MDEFLGVFDRDGASAKVCDELIYGDWMKCLCADEECRLNGTSALEGNLEPRLARLNVGREIEVRVLVVLVLLRSSELDHIE